MARIEPSRRSVLATIGGGSLLALGGAGIASAIRAREAASAPQTIYEIADSAGTFDTLVGALEATGLAEVLDGDAQYTVFAPTDQAFAQVDTTTLTADEFRNILLYHITNGRRYGASVLRRSELQMVNGDTVTVDWTTLNDGQAEIQSRDIEASNGVIHVIDGVLLP